MITPNNMSVAEIARREGISPQTLYCWRNELRKKGLPGLRKTITSDDCSPETKLAIIIETALLTQTKASEYCRKKGLFREQIQRWKEECLSGFQSSAFQNKTNNIQAKEEKAEIKSMKPELRYKDKALAETAALLVLRKKLNIFWGVDNEEN